MGKPVEVYECPCTLTFSVDERMNVNCCPRCKRENVTLISKGTLSSVDKITIPLTSGEWNTIIHALNHKMQDRANSKTAKKQYEDMYVKLTDTRFGEGSGVI